MSSAKPATSSAPSTGTGSAPAKNGPAPAATPAADDEPLATDSVVGAADDDIHAKLRALRLDEVAGLSQSPTNLRTVNAAHNYFQLILLESGRYIRFVWSTAVYIVGSALFGGLGFFDFFSITFFGIGGIIFLFIVLIFCLLAESPLLVTIYYQWSAKYGGGLGLVNSGNPNLFKALTQDQATQGKKVLSGSFKDSGNTVDERNFNLDAAKLLLQIASVIYEHENDAIRAAVGITSGGPAPKKTGLPSIAAALGVPENPILTAAHKTGAVLQDLFDNATANKASQALNSVGDQRIRDFAASFGMDFEAVSELNSTSSAFAGLFWDPNSNWIVVSFKGTAPLEFGEWLSDFNTKLVDVGTWVEGFGKCHMGFKERVYPQDVSDLGNTRPYDTISLGVRTLSKWLRKKNNFPEDKLINVWFTGHSLGCATASLVYCRMLMRPQDIGKKKTALRDAYLFAAPILCDRGSVDVFNAKMVEKKKEIKTMWRITSNGDAVATLLPELGDYRDIAISPNNAFGFSHLGTELKMRDSPLTNHLAGYHVVHGTPVNFTSAFSKDEIAAQRKAHLEQPGEQRREQIGILLQKIPLIGRVIAHCTIYYWDQLDRTAIGKCEWVVD